MQSYLRTQNSCYDIVRLTYFSSPSDTSTHRRRLLTRCEQTDSWVMAAYAMSLVWALVPEKTRPQILEVVGAGVPTVNGVACAPGI